MQTNPLLRVRRILLKQGKTTDCKIAYRLEDVLQRDKSQRTHTYGDIFILSALKRKGNKFVPFSFGRFTLFHPVNFLF